MPSAPNGGSVHALIDHGKFTVRDPGVEMAVAGARRHIGPDRLAGRGTCAGGCQLFPWASDSLRRRTYRARYWHRVFARASLIIHAAADRRRGNDRQPAVDGPGTHCGDSHTLAVV